MYFSELSPPRHSRNLSFQVAVEATLEHPFFVIGHGWSSARPDRTLDKYQLPCKQLKVGDVCISLTHCENKSSEEKIMMKPPLPPHEYMIDHRGRRSNSASPSDKLKRMSSSNCPSPLSLRPKSSTGFASPSKQVVFADPVAVVSAAKNHEPVKKRKIDLSNFEQEPT